MLVWKPPRLSNTINVRMKMKMKESKNQGENCLSEGRRRKKSKANALVTHFSRKKTVQYLPSFFIQSSVTQSTRPLCTPVVVTTITHSTVEKVTRMGK